MIVLIDINHPAHVHYFKNAVKILKQKGHYIIIVSRDRFPAQELLKSMNIKYFTRGKGSNHPLGKLFYTFKADFRMAKFAKKHSPDLYLSFASPYPHHIAWRNNKHSVTFTDTEVGKFHKILTYPFADVICTPAWFKKDLGKKHVRFNGFMESAYLHPKYFKPDPGVLDLLGIKKKEKYIIMRFVSWSAHHDIGHKGLSYENKIQAVKECSKYAHVRISSENPLPGEMQKYQIQIPPERMHDALYYASAYLGESPTMTTESALLGTPAVCVSSWACDCGNLIELKKHKMADCFHPDRQMDAISKVSGFLKNDFKNQMEKRADQIFNETINVTEFIVWFIENYPKSIKEMRKTEGDYLKYIREQL